MTDIFKAGHLVSIYVDCAKEHISRTHPDRMLAIEGAIYDEVLAGFRMPSDSYYFVVLTLVVPIELFFHRLGSITTVP
ncbi:MAG: hypothetical protein AUH79_06695 [Betaproteobacteria bacterium 13_1_40CM_4_64_4]|nr:MAG: hypothetical protein AUH79_06695 [Betaproteobacteria bacterium 13_1_40CM_4_64_4]